MDVQSVPTFNAPTCHRCKQPMVPHSLETVGDKTMRIFRCEACDTLEAVEADKAA